MIDCYRGRRIGLFSFLLACLRGKLFIGINRKWVCNLGRYSMSDEVELPTDEDSDEYELLPMGPVRKLEKRIQELEQEKGGGASRNELVSDILDIMKSNQKIVNDMVESTSQLHNSVETLIGKMDNVASNMNEFMELLQEASEASLKEDVSGDISEKVVEPLSKGMESLQETNEKMLQGLGKIDESLSKLDKRMKRMYASQSGGSRRGGGGSGGRNRRSRGG